MLYGICETVNGNWSQLDMTRELGASTTVAAIALTAFWAMVTAGRIGVAAVQRWLPTRVAYHALPLVLAVAFVIIAVLPGGGTGAGILAFGLAGLGCSALLPLTISFGQEQLIPIAAAMAGGVIAFYEIGYGIAAFGVGPLLDNGVQLTRIYGVRGRDRRLDGALVVRGCSSSCERTRASAVGAVGWRPTGVSPAEVHSQTTEVA